MATYYLDYEGGNDANDGLSFANRWKTFASGATAARIAPGDTIRVMASPDPTLVGNATWTSAPRPASVTIISSTNATPIVITTSSAHNLATGDYVAITSHTTNTNANGVWKVGTTPSSTTFQILQINGSNTTGNGSGSGGAVQKMSSAIVKLSSAVTQNIALCGGLGQKPTWTANTNVTTTQNTSQYREGYSSASIAIGAAFTTGRAAHYQLPSTLDLSAYQQVSFSVQQTSGTIGVAGDAYLALCSDIGGTTVVHTCNIPALGALNVWVPVTVNLGTSLSATIRSVALYRNTNNGAQTFLLDNIVACKASSSNDSLTLHSLISKSNGTGDECWFGIQSINADAVMIATSHGLLPNSVSNQQRGYYGTSETVSTYKREPIRQTPLASSTAISNTSTDSGTAGSLIAYSGGWNRTDMSTQTGETWFDGQNGTGIGFGPSTTSISYNSHDKLNAVRFGTGWAFSGTSNFYNVLLSYRATCGGPGVQVTSYNTLTGPIWSNNNFSSGISAILTTDTSITIGTVKAASNNNGTGISFNGGYFHNITSIEANNNSSAGVSFGGAAYVNIGTANAAANTTFAFSGIGINCRVGGGTSSSNGSGCVSNQGNGTLYLNGYVINDTNEVVATAASILGNVFSNRNDNTANNSWIYNTYWTVNQQTSIVDSPATTAWKMNPTNALVTAIMPARLKLGTVVCAASSLVTVTARMRRDNTGLTMRLICPGGQINGVVSDVFSDMTAAANTWETVTITFTPTAAGAVDIYAYAFGGTTYSGYVCNLTASQA